ncbi:MAG: DUF2191 domain-containing protein [Bryobacteraceae bacterium]|jgi:hypothetical protein
MKTTVEIADSLFEEVRACADSQGVSFRHLVEEGLREVVGRKRKPAGHFHLRDASFGRAGAAARISWPDVRAAIYGGRGE